MATHICELVLVGLHSNCQCDGNSPSHAGLDGTAKAIISNKGLTERIECAVAIEQVDNTWVLVEFGPERLSGTKAAAHIGRLVFVRRHTEDCQCGSCEQQQREPGGLVNVDASDENLTLAIRSGTIVEQEDGSWVFLNYDVLRSGDTSISSSSAAGFLSSREHDILRCLVQGSSNKQIARDLDITEATVKVHMRSLFRKLNVHNRTKAALWAKENKYPNAVPEEKNMLRVAA